MLLYTWLGLAGLKLDSFVDVAVSCWVLRADAVVCLLCVGRVQNKPRPVHQVVKVAVVCTIVQNWEGLWPGVCLEQSSILATDAGDALPWSADFEEDQSYLWIWRWVQGNLGGCTIKDDRNRTHFFHLVVLWNCQLFEESVITTWQWLKIDHLMSDWSSDYNNLLMAGW